MEEYYQELTTLPALTQILGLQQHRSPPHLYAFLGTRQCKPGMSENRILHRKAVGNLRVYKAVFSQDKHNCPDCHESASCLCLHTDLRASGGVLSISRLGRFKHQLLLGENCLTTPSSEDLTRTPAITGDTTSTLKYLTRSRRYESTVTDKATQALLPCLREHLSPRTTGQVCEPASYSILPVRAQGMPR